MDPTGRNRSGFQLAGTVSGHATFDEPVRPVELYKSETDEENGMGEEEETELNGVEEEQDRMADEDERETEGEGEVAAPDWKVKAELYAAALGASELKGIISLMRDLGQEKKPVLTIDAKATEHILHRQGIGKLKHIDVAYLWIQDEIRSRRLQVRRIKSEDNIADLGTKPWSKAVITKHCTTMGYVSMEQDEDQMGQQARGCPRTLCICAAGDHVQKQTEANRINGSLRSSGSKQV